MSHRRIGALSFLFLLLSTSFLQKTVIAEGPKPFLILNETLYSGLGAEFSAVLGALDAFEKGAYAGLAVELNNGLFFEPSVGPNWWEYYFEPISLGDRSNALLRYSSQADSGTLSGMAYNYLSRQRNYELVNKYVRLKADIQTDIDAYIENNLKGYFVIGVHHRGTDKVNEVVTVPWHLTLTVLQHAIKNLPHSVQSKLKIYVATDDQHFLNYLINAYPSQVIYGNFSRSVDDCPLHSYESKYYANNYEKGREAIIEAVILSKCNALIRPAPSGFSWIPLVFNPHLPANSIFCGNWNFPGWWTPPLEVK